MLYAVAPFVGAWIEIVISLRSRYRAAVAPFVGAWIEICKSQYKYDPFGSLRSSERGLKYY